MRAPPEGFTIRDATLGDVDEIAEIHVEGWETTYRGMLPDDLIESRNLEFRRRNWSERLADLPDGEFARVGELGGDVVAISSFGLGDPGDPAGTGVWRCLYMRRRVQRMGLGTLMRADTIRVSRDFGYRRLKYWVVKENEGSMSFFEGAEWTLTGIEREREDGSFHEVQFELDLGSFDV